MEEKSKEVIIEALANEIERLSSLVTTLGSANIRLKRRLSACGFSLPSIVDRSREARETLDRRNLEKAMYDHCSVSPMFSENEVNDAGDILRSFVGVDMGTEGADEETCPVPPEGDRGVHGLDIASKRNDITMKVVRCRDNLNIIFDKKTNYMVLDEDDVALMAREFGLI